MKITERIPSWKKETISSIIRQFFAAKGYRLDSKSLKARGPLHLRVMHVDKDHKNVEKDWVYIRRFVAEQFGWAPVVRWQGHHHDTLIILTGRI